MGSLSTLVRHTGAKELFPGTWDVLEAWWLRH